MLPLIWHKEMTVRKHITAVFYSLYLDSQTFHDDLDLMVENLVNLVDNLSAGELTSFEDMFVDILKEK